MRFIIGIFIVMAATFSQSQISELRSLYKQAAENEAAAKKLLKITEEIEGKKPLIIGYHGVSQMMMAKHVGNPFKKLSYFNKGKELFSKAIDADPGDVELRFLRFSVQAETPGFLNYKQNLQEDKQILLAGVPKIKDKELKEMILNYLYSSKELSASEKEKLNN